jgi:SNF2 family DNA or RNA helicase
MAEMQMMLNLLSLTVVDIELNDEDLETPSASLEQRIQDVLLAEEVLDWRNYSRTPFPHQVLGTRWILGLALGSEGLGGGLLADDMGLGKTFMSLASMDHLYQAYRRQKGDRKALSCRGTIKSFAELG